MISLALSTNSTHDGDHPKNEEKKNRGLLVRMTMNGDITFSSASISFHVQATEDRDRILKTLSENLQLNDEPSEEAVVRGHFGNEIRRIAFHLLGESARRFADLLFRSLSKADVRSLSLEIDKFTDDHGSFYIRLDKQLLLEGRLSISQTEAVRVKLKPQYGYKPRDMISCYCKFLDNRIQE